MGLSDWARTNERELSFVLGTSYGNGNSLSLCTVSFWESVVIVLSTILHCVPNSDLHNLESLVQL